MRLVSAIDVNWVAPLLPKLKDPVDVDRLNSGIDRSKLSETLPNGASKNPEEAKTTDPKSLLGKRRVAENGTSELEAEIKGINQDIQKVADKPLTKEEKLAQLKDRFSKR